MAVVEAVRDAIYLLDSDTNAEEFFGFIDPDDPDPAVTRATAVDSNPGKIVVIRSQTLVYDDTGPAPWA